MEHPTTFEIIQNIVIVIATISCGLFALALATDLLHRLDRKEVFGHLVTTVMPIFLQKKFFYSASLLLSGLSAFVLIMRIYDSLRKR